MSKGKKRDYSLPKGVSSRVEQSKLAKLGKLPEPTKKKKKVPVAEFEFSKGFEMKPGDVIPWGRGGYYEIPQPDFKKLYYNEFGDWDKEALAKLLGTDEKPEIKKDPLEEFTDEWYEKNKDSL